MEENPDSPFNPRLPSPPRRFVYRSTQPDTGLAHPLRRSTDFPHPFQGAAGHLCPKPVLLKFRVYLKVN